MIEKYNKIIIDFFISLYASINSSGLHKQDNLSRETIRLVGLVNVFGSVGLVYLVTMSLVTYLTGEYFHTIILLTFSVAIISFLLLQRFLGTHQLTTKSFMAMMILLCVYLTSTGGVDNNGHLWTFMLPPLFMFMYGFKKGIAGSLITLFIMGFILFYNNEMFLMTEYAPGFKGRYLAAYFGVMIVSMTAEYSRDRADFELLKLNEQLMALSRELDKAARTDTLTGLANRRGLYDRMDYERARMERNQSLYTILLGDIDHFKNVNDTYGHDCGDEVLKTVANIISSTIRKPDIVCRWGGEEFLIVFPDMDKESGRLVAEKIRKKMEGHVFTYKDFVFNLTISIGVECCSPENDFENYIVEVDKKLYAAKNSGRNRVVS